MSDRPLTPSELANRAREVTKKLRLGARRFGAIHTIVIEPEPFARLYEELADEVDRLTEELRIITAGRDWQYEMGKKWKFRADEERARADRLTEEKNDLGNALARECAKDGGTWDQAAYDQLAEECNRGRARADLLTKELTKVIEDERAQGEEVARLTEENKQITKDRNDWRNANNATAEDALRWLTQRDEERARRENAEQERNRAWSVRDRLDQQFSEQLAKARARREPKEAS